jgi:serine/threonine-protein kinase|nr:serine/threonine-protein kinase [Kofleriaceae bacterium]
MAATAPAAQRLLHAHLAAGSAERERFIAIVFFALTSLALVAVAAFAPEGYDVVLPQMLLFAPPFAYHAALLVALRRGWFHPIVPWLDAIVQTSTLAAPYYMLVRAGGIDAVTESSIRVGWVALVGASAMRASPRISLASGVLAAGELLAISLGLAGDQLTSQQHAQLYLSAAFIVVAGGASASAAIYVVRQADAALRAVREQDLMGKYLLHERLGAGGMAEVFRATYSPEGGFEKAVVVKRVLPEIASRTDGERFLAMFREEASLGASLAHPNVVQVLDAGTFRDRYVVAMELVDGASLARVLRRGGALPAFAVAYVGAELAAALDYIHARVDRDGTSLQLVHRDVNPPNVLVSRLGEIKLSDFGVAHAVNRASLDAGRVYGKLGYLAPEQVDGSAIDGRADLFALGLVLYELAVGAPLFRGRSVDEVADFRVIEAELPAELPPALARLIADLLAARPGDRPARGTVVRDRLLALAGDAAPYPAGQAELARRVREALADPPAESAATPATPATRDTPPTAATKLL